MSVQGQPRIEILLEEVLKHKASDLHLQVGLPPMLRVDGSLTPVTGADILNEEAVETLVFAILDEDQKQILLKDKEFDFSFAFGDLGRFRVNAFHERGNIAAALRLIPNEILSIEQLGLPPIVAKFADYPRGLVLVTGPTGSGKSTSLASLISKINQERATHIITIEDPIEFVYAHKKSIVDQREVGIDTLSFDNALKNAMRQAPDVILIGEVRDMESMKQALTYAETGHLCLATLHANNANQALERVISFFPTDAKHGLLLGLSLNLVGIVSQRLVPGITQKRAAAVEVMINSPYMSELIQKQKLSEMKDIMADNNDIGMVTFDQALFKLFSNGKISEDHALANADSRNDLSLKIRFAAEGSRGGFGN